MDESTTHRLAYAEECRIELQVYRRLTVPACVATFLLGYLLGWLV